MNEAQWTVVFAAEAFNDLLLITEYLHPSAHGNGFCEAVLADAERAEELLIEQFAGSDGREAVHEAVQHVRN